MKNDAAIKWHAGKAPEWETLRLGVGKYTEQKQRLALEALGASAGERVLDVGTGSGFFSRAAASKGAHVVAIDAAESMLKVTHNLAEREGLKIGLVRADASMIPFRDASFDKSIAIDLIGHLSDPADCIAEIGRVTRKVAIIAWPHSCSPYRLKYVFEKFLLRRSMPFTRWLSVGFIRKLMAGTGFNTAKIRTSLGVTAILEGKKK